MSQAASQRLSINLNKANAKSYETDDDKCPHNKDDDENSIYKNSTGRDENPIQLTVAPQAPDIQAIISNQIQQLQQQFLDPISE